MPTANEVRGSLFRLYKDVSGTLTPFGKAQSGSLSISADEIEIAHKDNTSGYKSYISDKIGATGNIDGIVALDETNVSIFDMLTDLQAGSAITMAFSTEVTGDSYLSFSAVITNLDINADDGDVVSYSVQYRVDGAITVSTVA